MKNIILLLFIITSITSCDRDDPKKSPPLSEKVEQAKVEFAKRHDKEKQKSKVQVDPDIGKQSIENGNDIRRPSTYNIIGKKTARMKYVEISGIPKTFMGVQNFYQNATNNDKQIFIKRGEVLFENHCAKCHGKFAMGNSPIGKSLNPPAPNLLYVINQQKSADQYLFWSIFEGGIKLHSKMPSYRRTIQDSDKWRIILYLNNLAKVPNTNLKNN